MAQYRLTYLKTPKQDSEMEFEMSDEWEFVSATASNRELGLLVLIWRKLEPEPETTGGL